jgi:PAS domain S-box-containing protein
MKLSELVNIEELRGLCESFSATTGVVTAILDLDGTILIAAGWQDICTRFHRVNDGTACRCRESDTVLAAGLRNGESYNIYKCKNGLVDVAMPILIHGEHIANFFTGQLFTETPDPEFFIRQAEEFGFDKDSYLDALGRVPLFSEDTIRTMLDFFTRLTRLIGEMGLAKKGLEEVNQELRIVIEERNQVAAALRDSEEKNRTLVHNLSSGLVVHAPDSSILFSNPMASTLLGLTSDQMSGKAATDASWCFIRENGTVMPREEYPVNRVLLSGGRLTNHVVGVCHPDRGDTVWVQCNAYPVIGADGKTVRVVVTFTDITQLRHAEEERSKMELKMLQTQKLESLGVLAGGIAHDFNNILMAIMGNADLALMRINPESPVVDNLKRIEQAAARAADLARQMLAYSGKGKFVVGHADMSRLVEEMLHIMEVSISKKAVLSFNLTKPIPTVEADVTQLRQIIMNLVINASEAIGDKSGVIVITTGCMECDKNYLSSVWLSENLGDGLYVYLEVSDTGCGMDNETLTRLFDPFFTTKFTGRGLGMSAVLGIVRGHKGAIRVYSEPGKGSSFKILLPAADKPAEIFNGNSPVDTWQGTGVVLLVDDEETVRAIGSEMLRELGFRVVTAEDGRNAVDIFKTRDDIEIAILDLTMPHLDGEQCFQELRRLNPELKVIMSSGFNQQEVTQRFTGKGLAGFIQKPYRLSALRDVIKEL